MMTDGERELEAAREEDQDNMAEMESVPPAEEPRLEEDLVNDGANDHRLSAVSEPESEAVVQNDKYAQELPITHLINPVNRRVFEANPVLLKRRDLIPCDKDGKKVYDHRCY